jgi:hypothetical protein
MTKGDEPAMISKMTRQAIKDATTASLEETRPGVNAFWRGLIDEELATRQASRTLAPDRTGTGTKGEGVTADNWVPDYGPSPFHARPGTPERFDEEDEAIHGLN